jgi:hypothetical protein
MRGAGQRSLWIAAMVGSAILSGACSVRQESGDAGTRTTIIATSSSGTGTSTSSSADVSIATQPARLDFGNVQVGTTSTLSVTVTNTGSTASDPISVSPVSGAQASDFGWTGTPTALGPTQSFTLQVTFAPAVQGQASALITYQLCTSCSPASFPLTGVGVDGQLVYGLTPIAFSNVSIGSTVSSGTITLTNIGTAAVEIGTGGAPALKLDTPSSVYALTGMAAGPIILQPLSSTTFGVTYTAATTSDPPDQVDAEWVPLDAAGEPVAGISPRIAPDPITGHGAVNPCAVTVLPPSLNFGNITVGLAFQKSVTVTNTGGEPCSITGIALDSGTDSAYSLVTPSQTSFTLDAGQDQAIAVSCEVNDAGPPLVRTGALDFQSTDPNQPSVSVPLTADLP